MRQDILMPHLMDIAVRPELEGLILAGGFGIRLKQSDVERQGEETVIKRFPEARATTDLDVFLRMEMIATPELRQRARDAIERLGYRPVEGRENWQFDKPLGEEDEGRKMKLDLLARHPVEGERPKLKPPRVGGGPLHGHDTLEAFAIDEEPIRLAVGGATTAGEVKEASVLVPHPYAWLNMKARAAHDYQLTRLGLLTKEGASPKHAFDVYVLVAMLREEELARCRVLAAKYVDHEVAAQIREEARGLFSTEMSPGFITAQREAEERLSFEPFREGLGEALGF